MKSKSDILYHIRRLPEGVRVILALFFMLVAAGFLFNSWTVGVSSGLGSTIVSESAKGVELPSDEKYNTAVPDGQKSDAAAEVSSPFFSVIDSVRSFAKIFEPTLSAGGLGNISVVKEGFDRLASKVSGFLGKIWERVYGTLLNSKL